MHRLLSRHRFKAAALGRVLIRILLLDFSVYVKKEGEAVFPPRPYFYLCPKVRWYLNLARPCLQPIYNLKLLPRIQMFLFLIVYFFNAKIFLFDKIVPNLCYYLTYSSS